MGKHNHGRFKTKVVASAINHAPPASTDNTTAATATTAPNTLSNPITAQPSQQPNTAMPIDTPDPTSTTPQPPTITLSRPFHPPHPNLLAPLAGPATPSLGPILLPLATPASRPLSGRQWRSAAQPASRSLTAGRAKAWKTRQAERQQRVAVRVRAADMAALVRAGRMEERRKREQRAMVKAANEKRNRVVQVIKDSAKIKRMSRAQLKMIEKA